MRACGSWASKSNPRLARSFQKWRCVAEERTCRGDGGEARHLPADYIAMVRAGEKGGFLDQVLRGSARSAGAGRPACRVIGFVDLSRGAGLFGVGFSAWCSVCSCAVQADVREHGSGGKPAALTRAVLGVGRSFPHGTGLAVVVVVMLVLLVASGSKARNRAED